MIDQIIAEHMTAHNAECIGCLRHDRDIMISPSYTFTHDEGGEETKMIDIYLTIKQAEKFHEELGERIEQSRKFLSNIVVMIAQGMDEQQIARAVSKNVTDVRKIINRLKAETNEI